MRATELLRAATRSALASRTSSLLIVILVAAMCASVLATVGRSSAAQRDVLARWEQAGARTLTIGSPESSGLLTSAALDQIRRLSTVERAIGTLLPQDVTPASVPGGPSVPSWTLVGDMSDAVELITGRWPLPGEALVSAQAQRSLGMDSPFGAVARITSKTEDEWPVVGLFRAREPFTDLDGGVVIAGAPHATSSTLQVVATHPEAVKTTTAAIVSIIAPQQVSDLALDAPLTLAELRGEVAGDLGDLARLLLIAVLALGGLLITVVVFADVLIRRADLGRRRALGATRTTIVWLVLIRAALAATIGVVVGTTIGLIVVRQMSVTIPLDFILAVGVLALLTTAAATFIPATFAATRDPVRVLRTP
ncbi:MAG: hypothetical protein Q4F65_11325 [Propionibacteriaceae bacterium]|nr:hypothetical protein [Propionibacteriaceae bacterium]